MFKVDCNTLKKTWHVSQKGFCLHSTAFKIAPNSLKWPSVSLSPIYLSSPVQRFNDKNLVIFSNSERTFVILYHQLSVTNLEHIFILLFHSMMPTQPFKVDRVMYTLYTFKYGGDLVLNRLMYGWRTHRVCDEKLQSSDWTDHYKQAQHPSSRYFSRHNFSPLNEAI